MNISDILEKFILCFPSHVPFSFIQNLDLLTHSISQAQENAALAMFCIMRQRVLSKAPCAGLSVSRELNWNPQIQKIKIKTYEKLYDYDDSQTATKRNGKMCVPHYHLKEALVLFLNIT